MWKEIEELQGEYLINRKGIIKNKKGDKLSVRQKPNGTEYIQVKIEGKKKNIYINTLLDKYFPKEETSVFAPVDNLMYQDKWQWEEKVKCEQIIKDYLEDPNKLKEFLKEESKQKVQMITCGGPTLRIIFNTINEATKILEIDKSIIIACMMRINKPNTNGFRGYTFNYVDEENDCKEDYYTEDKGDKIEEVKKYDVFYSVYFKDQFNLDIRTLSSYTQLTSKELKEKYLFEN